MCGVALPSEWLLISQENPTARNYTVNDMQTNAKSEQVKLIVAHAHSVT